MTESGTRQQAEGVGDAGTQGLGDEDAETRARGDAGRGSLPLPKGEGRGEGPHRRPPRAVLLLAALALAYVAWWSYTQFFTPPSRGIVASGTIESEEVSIASEVMGRVTELLADEGDRVQAGDVLVRLDDTVLRLQLQMASLAERRPLELQLDKMTIRSPLDGVVARRSIRVGEVASPGAPLMVVTKPDPVELTVYVPEKEIGRVRIGQKVEVQVDSFPQEVFPGEVIFIATRAEFTPRNVQTQKDRLNLVFAVKVQIPNSDLRLKPGMPADATILYQ